MGVLDLALARLNKEKSQAPADGVEGTDSDLEAIIKDFEQASTPQAKAKALKAFIELSKD